MINYEGKNKRRDLLIKGRRRITLAINRELNNQVVVYQKYLLH